MAAQRMDFSRRSNVQLVANALEITGKLFHIYKYYQPQHLLKVFLASLQYDEM